MKGGPLWAALFVDNLVNQPTIWGELGDVRLTGLYLNHIISTDNSTVNPACRLAHSLLFGQSATHVSKGWSDKQQR